MGSSTIRKAIGAVKDQTSISIAKVAGNVAPDLEVLVVKATSHDDEPADEKYIREILNLTSYSKGYVNAFVFAISKRLSKTRDWIVALKSLMLVHRLLSDEDPVMGQEIMYASRRGTRILNMSGFRDEAHSNSWDHSGFVRTYAMYLDEKLEFMLYERKLSSVDRRGNVDRYGYGEFRDDQSYGMNRRSRSYGDLNEPVEREQRKKETPVKEMKAERVLERLHQLLRILDRFLACRPTGMAKNSRMVLVALYPVVKESFRLYSDVCEVLGVLLDRFSEMEYVDCVKSFDAYVNAAKMIDELVLFYGWCKEIGVARSSEYPEVQKITDKLLGSLEGYVRERANRPKSPEKARDDSSSAVKEEAIEDMNGIKALPPPENYTPTPPPPPPVPQPKPQPQHVTEDLVNLKDDVSAEDQSNKLTLALFSGLPAANSNSSWEAFNGEPEVTSAWQTPAAESGKADWELALVESASNLSKQKADLAGGFDPLLLNGMYDQGAVRQHVSNTQLTGGSASSVALPGTGKSATPILALPAPDGTVQNVGHQDPFAASLVVPPPAYVQIADMEKKQHLLVQEQQLWQQYGSSGMQGQVGLAKIAASYGMPPVTGMGQPSGYYTSY
ncbi:epsin N-terminal homology (ENTH) domain-containing protein [Actinidia rufa]|uniref:Epsin N-terminal homology (ENTH) domain-containing protein n=1 Tax=Actinidia rufa TaxID=165716 RepID=A0A7J0DSU0_9ERIC|nr:epsin N-terminal homology (ENTH) domain-containing protein [Actinidia rufa]